MRAWWIVFFMVLAVLVPSCFAASDEAFSLTILSPRDYVYVGSFLEQEIRIHNNLDRPVEVSFYPPIAYTNWFTIGHPPVVELLPGGDGTLRVFVAPPKGTPSQTVTIKYVVCEVGNQDYCGYKYYTLQVIDKSQLVFVERRLVDDVVRAGSPIAVFYRLYNKGETSLDGYSVLLEVLNDTGVVASTRQPLPLIYSKKEYSSTINVTVDEPGSYIVRIALVDDRGMVFRDAYLDVTVKPTSPSPDMVEIERREYPGIMGLGVVLVARNNNEDPYEQVFFERATWPSFMYSVEGANHSFEYVNGTRFLVISCTLAPLGEPGDSCMVRYSVNYWILYVLGALVAIAAWWIYQRYARLKVFKNVTRKKGYHLVELVVRNDSGSELTNVVLRDVIPPGVTASGFTIKPSSTRHHKRGIVASWNLGKMAPGEERIIAYRVKMDILPEGGMVLPRAWVTFFGPEGVKEREFSGTANII